MTKMWQYRGVAVEEYPGYKFLPKYCTPEEAVEEMRSRGLTPSFTTDGVGSFSQKICTIFQGGAGASYDNIRKEAWLDCGCGWATDEPNTVNWHAPCVSVLEKELRDAGYTICGRCPHLQTPEEESDES